MIKSKFAAIMDILIFLAMMGLNFYLWKVERPKMELMQTCQDIKLKQLENYYNFKIDWDANLSWENVSQCPPCRCLVYGN